MQNKYININNEILDLSFCYGINQLRYFPGDELFKRDHLAAFDLLFLNRKEYQVTLRLKIPTNEYYSANIPYEIRVKEEEIYKENLKQFFSKSDHFFEECVKFRDAVIKQWSSLEKIEIPTLIFDFK